MRIGKVPFEFIPVLCVVKGLTTQENLFLEKNTMTGFTLDVLQVTDRFIIQNCIVKCNSAQFVFGGFLNGFMLDKAGVIDNTPSQARLNMCPDCFASLKRNKILRLALENNLYCGVLPEQFHDLTWVEEMVLICSLQIYSAAAYYYSRGQAKPAYLAQLNP
jgi:uncharacterized protein DUF6570